MAVRACAPSAERGRVNFQHPICMFANNITDMAVRKVIEDSDDEGHDDNNSPSRPSVDGSSMSSMKKFTDVHLSSSSSKSPQVHDESSTGSTGLDGASRVCRKFDQLIGNRTIEP